MRKINTIIVCLLLLACTSVKAQYDQNRSRWEPMFKVDATYAPFIANLNDKGANGYYLDDLQHYGGVNVVGGLCLSQDFFLGIGAGFDYFFVPKELGKGLGNEYMGIALFGDFDYRPLQDEFSPMVYARAGMSYMLSDGAYGNTMTALIDVGLGCNWYYVHEVRNMERNYKSLYLTLGFAYMQQTAFLPIRIGIRF